MKKTTKSFIYLLIELLDQLYLHTKDHSDLLQLNQKRLDEVKEELFRLTLEEKRRPVINNQKDLRNQLLQLLPLYLSDTKAFPKKEDLIHFAKPLQIQRLKKLGNKTRFDLIGNILVEIATKPESELIEIAQALSLPTSEEKKKKEPPSTTSEQTTKKINNWFDFYESLKR